MENGEDLPEELLLSGIMEPSSNNSTKPSFTSMSQADVDFALARALQQQEHAYLRFQMEKDGSEYYASGSANLGYTFVEEGYSMPSLPPRHDDSTGLSPRSHEEEADEREEETEGFCFDSDEALARALQEAEHREAAVYMMQSLINVEPSDRDEDSDDDGHNDAQGTWQDVDPDNMSYEELMALGDAVGTESKGLNPKVIAALPYSSFSREQGSRSTAKDLCVICRFDYEDGDVVSASPCRHEYHTDCIKNWLQINKVCPICSTEVAQCE